MRMASAGRGKARTKQATKHEIAERVQEIQMRQKNWMEQREVALKQKVNSGERSATVEKKPETKIAPSPKPTKNTSSENIVATSNHRVSKERFKSWMVAREKKGKMDHGDSEEEGGADVLKVSSSRTPGYASPEPAEWEEEEASYKNYQQSQIMNQMMSAEDFDARADSILTRVKYGLDKQDSSSNNNNAGTSDLSGHYCPVCRKLMKGDQNSPLIYVPCGHNTCISCSKGRELCPCCGSQASSKTRNIMLMQIIEVSKNKTMIDRDCQMSGPSVCLLSCSENAFISI